MNLWYPSGLEAFQKGEVDVLNDDIKAALLSSAYTFSFAHEFASSLAGVLAETTLANPEVASGSFYADDLEFLSVPIGDTAVAVVYYMDTGTPATSPLLGFVDRKADTVPLAVDTNDGNLVFELFGRKVWRL